MSCCIVAKSNLYANIGSIITCHIIKGLVKQGKLWKRFKHGGKTIEKLKAFTEPLGLFGEIVVWFQMFFGSGNIE